MTLETLKTLEVIEVMENFINKIRPEESIREKLDFTYKIENQSITIFQVRPNWKNPKEKMEHGFAKTTFVKKENHWKVFWLRANLKWESYSPQPEVKSLKEFVKLVEEDKHNCFFG